MCETGSPDLLQGCLDGHARIEDDRLRVDGRRCSLRLLAEPVASLGLAARLDADRCNVEQLQGDVIESGRVAFLELQLDLADRLSLAAGGTDLAPVNGRLDAGCRSRLDRKCRARHIGGKARLQIAAGNPVRQMLAAL